MGLTFDSIIGCVSKCPAKISNTTKTPTNYEKDSFFDPELVQKVIWSVFQTFSVLKRSNRVLIKVLQKAEYKKENYLCILTDQRKNARQIKMNVLIGKCYTP